MTRKLLPGAGTVTEPSDHSAGMGKREVALLIFRLLSWLVITCSLAALLAAHFRPQAEGVARAFVNTFGVAGMALGTFLADGLHFPIPPQFYMLLAIASGASPVLSFLAISVASVLAGGLGYRLCSWVSGWQWLERRTSKHRELLLRAFERYGYRAALLAMLLPIPYSLLCYLAGLGRLPRTFVLLLSAYRVPKLLFFYLLVHWGWNAALPGP
jgi:membrane protein YqaA with SNARE-associated domain